MNISNRSRDRAQKRGGTTASQMFAHAIFFAVCLTIVQFEFRPRTFTIGLNGKKSIRSELMILECSFSLKSSCLRQGVIFFWVNSLYLSRFYGRLAFVLR